MIVQAAFAFENMLAPILMQTYVTLIFLENHQQLPTLPIQ
jgi:hypothetical protein